MPAPQNPLAVEARADITAPSPDGVAFAGTADVTPTYHSRGVYIGADGDLKVDFVGMDGATGATAITFASVKAGTILPIRISKVYDAGTTCSGVILF